MKVYELDLTRTGWTTHDHYCASGDHRWACQAPCRHGMERDCVRHPAMPLDALLMQEVVGPTWLP